MDIFHREKLLYEVRTNFEHYQVFDMIYEGRYARVLFSGKKEAAFSGMPLDGGNDMLFDYIQRMYELVATVRPSSLLMIGGGAYTLPITLIRSLPDIQIDVVEIDPGLDDIAEGFFGLKANPRLKIIHADGEEFLKKNKSKYDMIIVDAFTNLEVPSSLAKNSVIKLLSKRLNKDGVVAMNIISAYLGRRSEVIRKFYGVYSKNFDHTTIYPADTTISLWTPQNFILIAQDGDQKSEYGLRFGAMGSPV